MDRLDVIGRWFGGRRTRGAGGARRQAAGAPDGIGAMLSCLSAQARRPAPHDDAAQPPAEAVHREDDVPANGLGLSAVFARSGNDDERAASAAGEDSMFTGMYAAGDETHPVVWSANGAEVTYTLSVPGISVGS